MDFALLQGPVAVNAAVRARPGHRFMCVGGVRSRIGAYSICIYTCAAGDRYELLLYSLVGQDIRLSPERPGFESRRGKRDERGVIANLHREPRSLLFLKKDDTISWESTLGETESFRHTYAHKCVMHACALLMHCKLHV